MDQERGGQAQRSGLCLTKVSLADGNLSTGKQKAPVHGQVNQFRRDVAQAYQRCA